LFVNVSDLLILDKSQVKKLEEDTNTAFENIGELMRQSVAPNQMIDELILSIADNMKSIMVGNGHPNEVQNICSLIQKKLSLMTLDSLHTRTYRLLPDEMKQRAYDHSSSQSLSHDSVKFPHQFDNYLKEEKQKLKSVFNLDWDKMRRSDIQEIQSITADLDVHIRNICTDKQITLMEATHNPLSPTTKKEVQHLRYLPRKPSKLLEIYKQELRDWSEIIYQHSEVADKFPPTDENLPKLIKSVRVWKRLMKPWVDAKHHLDWLGWYNVYKLLKEYNINKVADLTKITDDNDLPRGMTREAIQNWLQAKGPDFFIEFIKHAPGIWEQCMEYKRTLPAKYGLTNRMWGKFTSKIKR
jgi:hypothetical protein